MSNKAVKVLIVIPSLEPDSRLLQLLVNLKASLNVLENSNIEANILLVDDGSGIEYHHIFEQAKKQHNSVWTTYITLEEWLEMLRNDYTYVYLEYIDELFIEEFGGAFEILIKLRIAHCLR